MFLKQLLTPICRLLFLLSLTGQVACASNNARVCTNNWTVTGYYTPVESEFTGGKVAIVLAGGEKWIANKAFLAAVKMEGWGKTHSGWYIGYYGGQWHKSQLAKNAVGSRLAVGMVAANAANFAMDTKIRLPALGHILGVSEFVVKDRGSAIKSKHIDIYTGEGRDALRLSWKVTGSHSVCVSK